MSRLCRLKTAKHGDDGKWAYEEITKLHETKKAQAAVIERMRWYVQEYCTEHWGKEVLAIPTDSTQILDEVRKHERERVAEFILRTDIGKIPKEWQGFAADGLFKYAAAIRAME